MEQNLVDGLDFLKNKLSSLQTPIFIKNRFVRILANRFFGFSEMMRGNISLFDTLWYFLPSRFHNASIDEKISQALKDSAETLFKRAGFYELGAMSVYNRRFFPAAEESQFESWFHAFIMLFQIIEADQYHAKEFLTPQSIVIDAGANMGAFSVLAAHITEKGGVYSFEPSPKTFGVLRANLNPYQNAKAFNSALGDNVHEGTMILAESSGSNTMSDSGMSFTENKKTIPVQVITIDEFAAREKLSRIDFIKMDTEGYEMNIIRGARETIKKYSPILSLSAYHHKEDKTAIPELVLSINPKYKYMLSKRVEHTFVFWI